MLKKAGRCCIVLCTAFLCAALLVVPQILDKGLLFEGAEQYTFYSGSESSQAHITLASASEAAAVKLALSDITGESARYESAEEAFRQVKKYGGDLVCREDAAGVSNYYFYSRRLGGGVDLYGARVNLHVAVRGGAAAVGSPLIFGGY